MSVPHPTRPVRRDRRDARRGAARPHHGGKNREILWRSCGMGVEPGFSDVAARYAADHLFSRIDEIGVRDGADLVVDGYDFAPTFSIWTTIEECLNPPIDVRARARLVHHRAVQRAGDVHVPRGHRPARVRQRRARGGRCSSRAGSTSGGSRSSTDSATSSSRCSARSTSSVSTARHPSTCRGSSVSPRDVVAAVLPEPRRARQGHDAGARAPARSWCGAGLDGRAARDVPVPHRRQRVVDEGVRSPGGRVADRGDADGRHRVPGERHRGTAPAWSAPKRCPSEPFLDVLDDHGVEWEWDDYNMPDRTPQGDVSRYS